MIKKLFRKSNGEDLDKALVFAHRERQVPTLSQFKLLPKLLKPKEFWWLGISVAVVLAIIAAAAGKFLLSHLEAVPISGGTYAEAVVGTPKYVNPILAVSDVDKDLNRLVYSPLLEYNDEGKLIGDLAEAFSIEENGMSVKFSIRDGVLWHDGEQLTAEDVAFTMEAIKDAAWDSPLWKTFQDVSIEQPDNKTIIVKSRALVAGFADLFTFGILPKHIWKNVDPELARLSIWNLKPVGSGPFKFQSFAKTKDGVLSAYNLIRNDGYYLGKPYIKEFKFVFFPDFESALGSLRTHNVDGVSFVPERLNGSIPKSGVQARKLSLPRFTGIFFNARNNDVLADKSARRALAKALDRKSIAELVPNAEPSAGPFLKSQFDFNAEEAVENPKDILANGGWKQGEDGWTKDGKQLKLTITVPDEQVFLKVSNKIKSSWEELGVKVQLEAASRLAFEKDVLRPRDYEVLVFSLVMGLDVDPFEFWHSTQIDDPGLNLSSVTSRNIDVVLERGRSTLDQSVKTESYREFQNLLTQEAPSIILYNSPYIYAIPKQLGGFTVQTINEPADRLNSIQKWFVRSRPGWK